MVPNSVVALPLVVILTTAGPALAATSMIAESSSMVTGWRAETVAPTGEEAGWACCSKAPVALSATTVPPDARAAASSAAPTTVPAPLPRRGRSGVTVVAGAGVAGSYQRSCVGWWVWLGHVARSAQSGRDSGAGE